MQKQVHRRKAQRGGRRWVGHGCLAPQPRTPNTQLLSGGKYTPPVEMRAPDCEVREVKPQEHHFKKKAHCLCPLSRHLWTP